MSKPRKKKRPPKHALALPDLEQSKAAVLNTLTSKSGQRSYDRAITDFVDWYCSEPRLAFNRTVVLRYRNYLEQKQYAATTINLRLAAVRRVAFEAADSGLLSPELAAGIRRVKGVRRIGVRVGNWLTAEQAKRLLAVADRAAGQEGLRHDRDAGRMRTASRRVAWPSGCLHLVARGALGYRRPPGQSWAHPYRPNPIMGEGAIDEWKEAGGITEGSLFRSINKTGRVWGTGMTPKVLWEVVRAAAKRAGIEKTRAA